MRERLRLWVQIVFAALTNGYLYGILTGQIYTGPTKAVCVPGLNCYSCPGALGACPIGSLQAVLGSRKLVLCWGVWSADGCVRSDWLRICFIGFLFCANGKICRGTGILYGENI